ncbi:MAG: hydrolase 1, exosortase A system-associated [Alphaproteobacteria bacterium]|nr:hydrolase 1, exosortase A system-associated [Alphaproteobacteria bacterium]
MSRLALTFNCQGATLAGTLDTAPGTSGLLLVSGGNEIRSGAFAGQARFAAEIARAGFPVFRFDRRGTGDSEGPNRGFRHEGDYIAAALAAFRAMTPQLRRVVGMGNCDAASALMLAGGGRCDALVLSNPWTIEEATEDATPPASAIRARYLAKLANPREVMRLVSGKVDLGKLMRGIAKAARPKAAESTLAMEMRAGLERFEGPVRILLAEADRTAQVFAENWTDDPRIARCPGAGHAYVEPHARQWLREQVLAALRG